MSWCRCCAAAWFAVIACSSGLSSCTTYNGPMTQDPSAPLPKSVLTQKAAEFEYYDAIEIRFTDGSSVQRRFRSVRGDQLLTFKGRGNSRREFSDPLESISGIRSREVDPTKSALAVICAAGVGFVIYYIAMLSALDEAY